MSTESLNETLPAVEVTHSPARFSSILAVAAALVAVLTGGMASFIALLIGLFGLGGVAAGLFAVHSRRLTATGTGVIFTGILLSGLVGAAMEVYLVVSTLATILAFDYGQNAFSVGAQMSDETETQRGELVHAAASLAVGTVAIVVAYGIYLAAAGGQSAGALAFLLFGGVVLIWAVRS